MESSRSQETAVGPKPMAASSSDSRSFTAVTSGASVTQIPVEVRSDTSVPVCTASSSAGIPPGHKLIKTRKEDGTFVTEVHKMSSQEAKSVGKTRPISQIGQEIAPPKFIISQGVQYKVITVRDSNGVTRQMKRPVGPQDSSTHATTQDSASRDTTKAQSSLITKSEAGTHSSPTPPASGTQTEPSKISSRADEKAAISPISSTPGGLTILSEEPLDIGAALADQKEAHRQKRTRRMKQSLVRGLGTIVGSSVGHMNLDMDHEVHGGHDADDGVDMDTDGQAWSDDNDDDSLHEYDGPSKSTHGKLPSLVKQRSKLKDTTDMLL